MSASSKKITKEEVSQTFNLVEIFGKPLPEDLALSFGQAIIDHILERSLQGVDVNGQAMEGYSESYAESLPFNARGKSKSEVNMRLRSNMMYSMDILEASPRRIKIGFRGRLENNKAFGHMSGMEGHPVLDGVTPKREFFGLSDNDIDALAAPISLELPPDTEDKEVTALSIFEGMQEKFVARERLQAPTRTKSLLDILDDFGMDDIL